MEKLVIEREKWRTMALFPVTSEKCCAVGHYLMQQGIDSDSLDAAGEDYVDGALNWPIDTYDRIFVINDDVTDSTEREAALIVEFAKVNVELSFTGDYR